MLAFAFASCAASLPALEPEAERPTPRPEAPLPPLRGPRGNRTQAEVLEGILSGKRELQLCATKAGLSAPSEHGKVVIDFTINPDGSVSNVEAVSQSTRHTLFARCVVETMSGLRFGPGDQPAEVRFPFKF